MFRVWPRVAELWCCSKSAAIWGGHGADAFGKAARDPERSFTCLSRYAQKYPIEFARAEEIDEGELPDHQASGGQKQTALTMIDLNYSAQAMKPIHVYSLNVRPRYK